MGHTGEVKMPTLEVLRQQAAAFRRAASHGKAPNLYLLDMAEQYERQAAELEAAYAGNKPRMIGGNEPAGAASEDH
jgi:hypothetical protein